MAYQLQSSLLQSDSVISDAEPDTRYHAGFIDNHRQWFDHLQSTLRWNSQFKSRKTATFGVSYNYSKGIKKVKPIPGFLLPLCRQIQKVFGYSANNCLVNYYPDGNHYISFHSDQDTEMKAQTGVTIVSLGAVRTMVLRSIENPQSRFYYPLQPGSALFMADALQADWQHGVPKEAGKGPRISLSFRSLIE